MFVDQVKIEVKAGKGGDGSVAFRREKFVPKGGPAGGDGGRGGNIIFVVDEGLRTLMDFRYKRKFKAANGGNGQGKKMHGANAKDTFIQVPPGTIVRDNDSNKIIGDLVNADDQLIVAKGGRGGKGNTHYATSRQRVPEIAENGEPGQERSVTLELKVLADVGLVGFPSVGKSTFLSVVTSAKPKIAAYEFTTLVPNLGMVQLDDGRDFVMADLPGLIKGASQGVGLGIQFLRHVERTRVILHFIDMSENGRDPYSNYLAINDELANYNADLTKRPQIIVATKMDLPGSQERLTEFEQKLKENKIESSIFPISSITHDGVNQLLRETVDLLDKTPKFSLYTEDDIEDTQEYKYTDEPAFTIEQDEDGIFVVSGRRVERLVQMSNLAHEDGVLRFATKLREMGVDTALRGKGAQNGDTVMIDDFTFDFVD